MWKQDAQSEHELRATPSEWSKQSRLASVARPRAYTRYLRLRLATSHGCEIASAYAMAQPTWTALVRGIAEEDQEEYLVIFRLATPEKMPSLSYSQADTKG